MVIREEVVQANNEQVRDRETLARQVGETLVQEYPVLTDEDVLRLLESGEATPPPETDEEEDAVEPLPAAQTTAEGSRALYGYAPERRYGAVALAAAIQSDGFKPAGLSSPRRSRPARGYPAINGVYQVT